MQGATSYKHTTRTYFEIYNGLTAAYPKKPTWLFKEFAGGFEFFSEVLNRVAQDILYPKTRESAYSFADRCDYYPVEADGSLVTLTITLSGAMSKTLPARYQVGGISTSTGQLVIFELVAAASSSGTSTITAVAKQLKTISSVSIGTVSASTEWLEFPIDGYTKIVKNTITLSIDGNTWTRVDNFDESLATDKHFMLIYQSAGKCRIVFGDGVTGAIPGISNVIYATFSVTEGLQGQLGIGEITTNVGGDSDITGITNAAATSGGNDAESIASIIRSSRANVRTRNVVWSEEDVEATAIASSSSVIKALCIPGLGACVVHIIPSGGGVPGAPLLAAVKSYIQSYTQFGKMPVTCIAPTYVSQNIAASITVRAGFTSAVVQDLVEFAMTLVTSAIDQQVIESYLENGIDYTRANVINSIWSWAFTSAENEALGFIIAQWIDYLGSRDFREWNQSLEVGHLWRMGDSLYEYGVDVFSLTSPTVNVVPGTSQIINTGTVTITVV
jgi:hypothetical protein